LKRLSPYHNISNRFTFHYLSQKIDRHECSNDSNAIKSIIQNSFDSIFILTLCDTIGAINSSVTSLLGYGPELLLAQDISLFISPDDYTGIFTHLSMMKKG
jgi:PAS domain-containing protein